MELDVILDLIVKQFPAISGVLIILGSLVVLGQIVVVFTPSTKDDAAWAKIEAMPVIGMLLKAVTKFSIIQKK
jgi:hypothetical protein